MSTLMSVQVLSISVVRRSAELVRCWLRLEVMLPEFLSISATAPGRRSITLEIGARGTRTGSSVGFIYAKVYEYDDRVPCTDTRLALRHLCQAAPITRTGARWHS